MTTPIGANGNPLSIPTIHLNGTSRAELLRELVDAHTAVNAAVEAIQRACPNGRDYYVQGPDALGQAMDQHVRWQRALLMMSLEIMAVAEAIA